MKRAALLVFALAAALSLTAAPPSPESYFGFRIGSDKKLVRWDKIVEYLQKVAAGSDRVRMRTLGPTTQGNPFVLLEIAAPDTLKNLDRYKQLERKLYFQDGAPSDAERDEIFRSGKAVVLITNNIHSTEIGASQMVLEAVYRLATENSPEIRKILDNVIFLLVPSLNPDGQIMVTDWYNKNLGTPYEASPLPWLYHPYVGHDNNRDMYLFSQKESRLIADVLWHDWFPSIWLDEHQQGSAGARIFTMPATDPINPNVAPLIYTLNGIYGQSQSAALEAEGKIGIIHNATYTNFWQGAMAWSGWWHNEVGLLTEVASARIATPVVQQKADPSKHTGHFWSLAIEEQFYLLWPVIFLLLGNRNRRLVFVGALFVFSPCWYFIRVHYLSGQLNPMSFDLRCVWLLAGCVLALARHDERLATTLRSRMLQHPTVPWLAVVFICYVGSTLFRIGALAPAAQAFGVALVINYAVEHQGGLLNWAPMVWLGNLSYSLYLWQQIFCWRSQLGIFGQFPLNVVAAVAAAACSFYFLERPLAAVRRRVPHIPNTNLFRWNRSWAHIISRAPQQAEHGS